MLNITIQRNVQFNHRFHHEEKNWTFELWDRIHSKRLLSFKMFVREIRLQLLKPTTSCFSNIISRSAVTFLTWTFGMCFQSVNNGIKMWEINTVYPSSSIAFRNEKLVGRNKHITESSHFPMVKFMFCNTVLLQNINNCVDPWCSLFFFFLL